MTSEQPKRRGRPPKIKPENQISPVSDAPVPDEGPADFGQADVIGSNGLVEAGSEPTRQTLPQLDHDHDGAPGGSWPQASLTENEARGLIAEFFAAYEGQIETKRVDGFNRIWTFRHEAIKSQDTMVLHVKRGPVEYQAEIPSSMARFVDVGEKLNELDRMTAR